MADTPQSGQPTPSADPATLRRELADLRQHLAEQERELARVRASEDQLRVLVERTKIFFWVASLDMKAIHYVSSEYELMWGRTRESLYADPLSWLRAIHPEDQPKVMAMVNRRRRDAMGLPPEPADGPAREYNDYRVIQPDGSLRWVRGRSFASPEAPNMILGVAEDVTEIKEYELALQRERDQLAEQTQVRKAELEQMSGWLMREATARLQTEESLRQSEELYRLLAEHSTDMITKHNREGLVVYASPAARELLGFEPQELLGKDPDELLHPDDLGIVRETYEKIMAHPGVLVVSYRMRRKDGAYTWLETTSKMIHDRESLDFENIICVTRDVTARKEGEARTAHLEQQLAHAARVSTLGELAAGLAHELNQPLTAIGNYLETCRNLLAGVEVPESALQTLVEAGAEAQRAGRVIQSLRNLVRASPTDQVLSNLNDLAVEVMELFAAHLRMGDVTLDLVLDRTLPPVLIDPVQIQQVIMNLIQNALDSMARSDGRRVLTVRTAALGSERVELTVMDTGPGVPDGNVAILFEPFHTTKPTGLGLGLAICRGIVEAHGGILTGQANPAGGLVFAFTLPSAGAPSLSAGEGKHP